MLRVAPKYATGTAYRAACGRITVFEPVDAQIAFDSHISIIVILHGTKWACLHTILAANAKLRIDEHDTLIVSRNGINRTCRLTGCIGAMVTVDRDEVRGVFNDPNEPRSHAEPMLLLAGHLTTMAAHTVRFEIP